MQWVFETLGIDKDADARVIRKAYAKAIKQCDQASDVEGFQKIRRAYELALQWAERRESVATGRPSSSAAPSPVELSSPPALPMQSSSEDVLPHLKMPPLPVWHAMPTTQHHTQASAVLDALVMALEEAEGTAARALLEAFSKDDRLTSLDEKTAFEQGLLAFCFAKPPHIALLDAACDLFGWETSNKHFATRPDLLAWMHRQLALRNILSLSKTENLYEIEDILRIYQAVQRQPGLKVEPWQIVKANQMLERYAQFRQELNDRYGVEALDWWQHKLSSDPGLLQAYRDRQAKEKELEQPKSKRSLEHSNRGNRPRFMILLPVLAVFMGIFGHSQFNESQDQQSAYVLPGSYHDQQLNNQSPASLSSPMPSSYDQDDVEHLRHRADQGQADAEDYLGKKYENGQDVPKDPAIAAIWYGKAAKRGFADAQYNLGVMYMQGVGVPKMPQVAIQWWEAAAIQGHLGAQSRLAEAYAKGDGVKQDYRAASHWLQLASAQGSPSAEDALGDLYATGHGVVRDYDTAVSWYRKAAAQGDAVALTQLGLMYEAGKGVHRNMQVAYALMSMASGRGGSDPAQIESALARLTKSLTLEQRSSAATLAGKLASSRDFLAELDLATGTDKPS